MTVKKEYYILGFSALFILGFVLFLASYTEIACFTFIAAAIIAFLKLY